MYKSYVTIEQHICPVCGKTFDTGNILLDKRLKDSFDRYTPTGYSLCPEHQKQKEDGYIFLIELAEEPRPKEEPKRTGNIASIRRIAAEQIFAPDVMERIKDIAYIDKEAFAKIAAMAEASEHEASEQQPGSTEA